MKATKKLTVSAMTVALGVLFMTLGSVFSVLDLSCAVLASMLVAFVYLEIGAPYTWLVWLATSLISFLLFPGSFMWLTYLLVYGVYPILKGYIERLPRPIWLILKLAFLNGMMTLLVLFSEVLVGQSFFGDVSDMPFDPSIAYAVLWGMLNLAFILYDRLIVILVVFYERRIRPRLSGLLK